MLKKVSVLLAVLLIAGFAIPFAGAQEATTVLRYPINPDPEHLNPFTATTIAIGTINRNIYEGLARLDLNTMEPIPNLAESWEVSEDHLTYTFHLRHGVLFHDVEGVTYENDDREFKADDWIWAAHIVNSADETISQHPEIMEGVVGWEAHRNGEAETISGITKIDDYTFQVQLERPNRLFFTVGAGTVPVVSPEAYEQLGEDFANHPVGTGPYMFVEWQRDDHITLRANPEYWRQDVPSVDEIRFINVPDANTQLLMYRNNELDFLFGFPTGQLAAVREEFADEYHERPGLNTRYFGFKWDQGFFAEHPLVRQAFAHAFNRDLVWNDLMEGARLPGNLGVLPPAMPASTPAITYPYDLERAAELLAEAGFPNGEGIPPIQLYVFASARDELSLPVLQEDLRQLGVELEIVAEDSSTYWNHIGEDDVIFFLSGWSAGVADPSDTLNYLFMNARDDTYYNNPAVNVLLERAMEEFDAGVREQLYLAAHNLIMLDCPVIVSAYSKVMWLQKPWVENFVPSGGGTYTAPLWNVTINTELLP
jgi:ABC-type transport system substrate-binding protein